MSGCPRYVLSITAFGGMDGVMRVVNILRRGKVRYRRMDVEFDGSRVKIRVCMEGASDEVRWVAAKLERLPETYSVRVEVPPDELKEEVPAATPG